MLLQFVVENFRSFRERTVLGLTPGNTSLHPEHVTTRGGVGALRCAALYGANASGKSNLYKALAFARRYVVRGRRADESTQHQPFRLDEGSSKKPSRFEFVIAVGRDRHYYSYGFSVGADRIEEEWLFETVRGKERKLYVRESGEVELGDALSRPARRKQFLEFVAEGTRPNQLFLTEANERNVRELGVLATWFSRHLKLISPSTVFRGLASRTARRTAFREFLGRLLQDAGTGIDAVTTKEVPLDAKTSALAREARFLLASGEAADVIIDPGGAAILMELKTVHTTSAGAVEFGAKDESDGSVRLLHLAPVLYDQGRKDNTFVVDELDRSLHPLLVRFIVKAFLSASPSSSGQLLFTTHETNLLDRELLRDDEIWFVEKDARAASHLYSLAEFSEEQLALLANEIGRGYLVGRFGAIPFLGDPRRLTAPIHPENHSGNSPNQAGG